MGKRRFKENKKYNPYYLLLGLVILTSIGIGVTLALVLTNTEQKENTFIPGSISCQVQEDYTIKNTGNTNSYIRADVIVNWVDESGNIYAMIPEYTITLGADWEQSAEDGYYYYGKEVEKENSTTSIISDITTTSTAPEGYSLSITVLAEAIQIEDENKAIENAWGR